jgi:hypothetical protein
MGPEGLATVTPRSLLIALAMLAGVHSAYAHGIAGNRFFPGTLSFDDPAVADEAILPNFAGFKRSVDGGKRCRQQVRLVVFSSPHSDPRI